MQRVVNFGRYEASWQLSVKPAAIFCEGLWHPDGSRDSSVGIATGYGLDDGGVGVRVLVGSRMFSCPRRPDRL
jgi:hypothetical protein